MGVLAAFQHSCSQNWYVHMYSIQSEEEKPSNLALCDECSTKLEAKPGSVFPRH